MMHDDTSNDWLDSYQKIPKGEKWVVERQGKYFRLKRQIDKRHSPRSKKGRVVKEFSRQARFRMLQFAAKVDWPNVGKSLFITLTYPDSCVHRDHKERNRERREFQRLFEEYVNRHVPCVWRVEWVRRKSGDRTSEWCPHIHLLVLGVRYVSGAKVNEMWKAAIRFDGYVRTETKRAGEKEVAALYIAKYCAKFNPECSLVNVPHLEKTGRHYGYQRKHLIPLFPVATEGEVPLETVRRLRKAVSGKLKWYDLAVDSGFCILGDFAEALDGIIRDNAIDRWVESVLESI